MGDQEGTDLGEWGVLLPTGRFGEVMASAVEGESLAWRTGASLECHRNVWVIVTTDMSQMGRGGSEKEKEKGACARTQRTRLHVRSEPSKRRL